MQLISKYKQLSTLEKATLIFSYILQASLGGAIFLSIYRQNWWNTFLVSGILLLTFLPALLRRNFKIILPLELEVVVVLFIYASFFLGEIHAFYTKFWWWDVVLHTGSGIILGLGGFLLVYVLNKERSSAVHLKPIFVAFFAFTFALAIGGIWEIFEFFMDGFFALNMQKSGLVDTMWDLIVDTLGALFIAALGYFYIRKNRFIVFYSVLSIA